MTPRRAEDGLLEAVVWVRAPETGRLRGRRAHTHLPCQDWGRMLALDLVRRRERHVAGPSLRRPVITALRE